RTPSKRRQLMLIRRTVLAALLVGGLTAVASAQPNGRSTLMPAYYDDQIFQINFTELASEDTLIAHNGSINFIYMSDECMPGGNMFVAVIDAIQGDGFNPLWQEVQIHFDNPDFPCKQLTSDTDIVNAAMNGLVSLEMTGEVYRCSVVGPKK